MATLSMVQRYAHLSPGHLVAAVEKIAPAPSVVAAGSVNAVELGQTWTPRKWPVALEG